MGRDKTDSIARAAAWSATALATALVAWLDLSSTNVLSEYDAVVVAASYSLAAGHGLHPLGSISAMPMVEVSAGAVLALMHVPAVALRLVVLPAPLLILLFAQRLAREAGADEALSWLGAACLACFPLTLALSTSLMSDTTYLAMLLGAVWLCTCWVARGERVVPAVVLTLLAALQREHAARMAIPVFIGLVLASRRRTIAGREKIGLAVMALGGLAIIVGLPALGLFDVREQTARVGSVPGQVVGSVLHLPIMLGLVAIPLLPTLLATPSGGREGRWSIAPVGLAMAAATTAAFFGVWLGQVIFPGTWFGAWGIGPAYAVAGKPPLLPVQAFVTLEVLTLLVMAVALVRHRGRWASALRDPTSVFLLIVALVQLPDVFLDSVIDRHFLPLLAVAIPLLVARLSQPPVIPARWRAPAVSLGGLLVLCGVGFYVVAELSFQAWLRSRGAPLL